MNWLEDVDQISNSLVLNITLIGFFLFVVAEFVASFLSGSLSLLGDASAMSIDVFAYAVNMAAETAKDGIRSDSVIYGRNSLMGISVRWRRLFFECIAPLISVLCLVSISIYIAVDAINVINNKHFYSKEKASSQDNREIEYMFSFAAANLVLDVICGFVFFIRGKYVFLEKLSHANPVQNLDSAFYWNENGDSDSELESDISDPSLHPPISNPINRNIFPTSTSKEIPVKISSPSEMSSTQEYWSTLMSLMFPSMFLSASETHRKNLNMITAFTHVSGDLLRTLAVLAAAITSFFSGLPISLCDAIAAIIVTITIIILIIPVIKEIYRNYLEIEDLSDVVNFQLESMQAMKISPSVTPIQA